MREAQVLRIYGYGFRRSLAAWPVTGLLFGANLLPGVVFAVAAWVWLGTALDDSLATSTLASRLDANVLVDLVFHHRDGMRMLGVVGAVLLAGAAAAWIGLNAVAVAAVAREGVSLRTAWSAGSARTPSFALLWATAMLCIGIAGGGSFVAANLWWDHTAERPTVFNLYGPIGMAAIFMLGAVLVVTTIHDHARVRCIDSGDGAIRSWVWSCFHLVRDPRTIVLTALFALTIGAGWAMQQAAGRAIAIASPSGLAWSLAIAEIFMLFRSAVRVWAFAAATELQLGSVGRFDRHS
jgi:hypothetical protein